MYVCVYNAHVGFPSFIHSSDIDTPTDPQKGQSGVRNV